MRSKYLIAKRIVDFLLGILASVCISSCGFGSSYDCIAIYAMGLTSDFPGTLDANLNL